MNDDIAIRIKNITKTYTLYKSHADRVKETFHPFRKKYHRPFNALNNVSLDVKRGETVGIIGRNGGGKSTMLQIICGILQPTSGSVEVAGRVSALLELGAGFNPEFTGRQNVYINAAILGMNHEEIGAHFDDIAAFADIGDFIDQPVKTYSSGMYVRLAFAIAINVDPDILLVDEALSVGDTIFQSRCFAKFREFQEKGITIVLVTHSLDLITRFCSTAHLLEQGQVHASGFPKDVVDEYNRLIVKCSGQAPVEMVHSYETQGIIKAKQWNGLFQVNPDENRYGNGKAEILEAGIFSMDGTPSQTLLQGEIYEFRLKVRFKDTIPNPILAYTVKDVKGFDISGTNTLYQNIDTGTVNEDDVLLATFTHKILLNPGGYLLSFGCAGFENGEYVVYERRYDYLSFDVTSTRASVGFFDLESKIAIRKV
jgi:teichoic acid transport system ATP-binding protein